MCGRRDVRAESLQCGRERRDLFSVGELDLLDIPSVCLGVERTSDRLEVILNRVMCVHCSSR